MSNLQKIVVLCVVGCIILVGGFFLLNNSIYNEKQADEPVIGTSEVEQPEAVLEEQPSETIECGGLADIQCPDNFRCLKTGMRPDAKKICMAKQPSEIDISNWETYRNDDVGFEVEHPPGWRGFGVMGGSIKAQQKTFGLDFYAVYEGPLYHPDWGVDFIEIQIDSLSNDDNLSLDAWLDIRDADPLCDSWNWDYDIYSIGEGTGDSNQKQVVNGSVQGIRRVEKCQNWGLPRIKYYFPLEEQQDILEFRIVVAHPDPEIRAEYLLLVERIYDTFRFTD